MMGRRGFTAALKFMRPKFVILLTVVTAVILAGVLFLKPRRPAPAPAVSETNVSATPAEPEQNTEPMIPTPVPAPAPAVALTPEQRQSAIEAEVQRLFQAGTSDDPADLAIILADLSSPEKEIREAAIQAAKQFGSTNAIPALQAAAENTTDPKEKVELTEAADFIALPSFSLNTNVAPKSPEEIQALQQQIAQSQADRQARMQKHLRGPGQNSPASPAPDPNAVPPQ